MPDNARVAVIGLDCAEPSLVFDRWLDDLPNLRALTQRGIYGELESCIPPITVPAWSCMAASKDPGTLGIYGFRNRADYSYDKLAIATSLAVREPRIWDILTDAGRDCIIVGVPGTFPITRPIRGCMVTSFLTPDTNSAYTWPRSLKDDIARWVGEYLFDVKGFRTENKKWLLDQIYEMTRRQFEVCRRLLERHPWHLFWMVSMGPDRIHHGFWQFMDPSHHRYRPGNEFENAIHDYYVYLDREIGTLLELLDPENTSIWVVSDHGAKCMTGGFCFNDWLIREGYLVLKNSVSAPTRFQFDMVDWSRTRVWGEGGYYGRCFINVRGREPQGTVDPADYESLRDELIEKLHALPDHRGNPMGTRAYRPQQIYDRVTGVPPDLVVIFGDLNWRSVGSVGNPDVYTFENDTGPDDANHAQQGLYILTHPDLTRRGRAERYTLYDVAPTILNTLGLPVPPDMRGRPIL